MTLGDKQRRFTLMLAMLTAYMYAEGYEFTLGRGRVSKKANEADGGHKNSLHLMGLAQDYNIFKDRDYLRDGTGHDIGHDFWDSIGGAERIPNDLNHYSYPHGKMR